MQRRWNLSLAGVKGKVFEPYKGQESMSGEIVAALVASVLLSASEGVRTAEAIKAEDLQVAKLWLPLATR